MIQLHPYNPQWPDMFERAIPLLNIITPIQIHHIGSTSVPGLASKPELDILCIVKNLEESKKLEDHGFIFKGEINIPLRYFFSKNDGEIKTNLHVVPEGHSFIPLNLGFRDLLRNDSPLRDAYGVLKQNLASTPGSHLEINGVMPQYTLGKNDFIKHVLEKTDFSDYSLNFCIHHGEWSYFDQVFHSRDTYSFVLYQGPHLVGALSFGNRGLETKSDSQHREALINLFSQWAHHHKIPFPNI